MDKVSSITITNSISNINKRNRYSALEQFVIDNNIYNIQHELHNGMTIFINNNNKCLKICNGFYTRIDKPHPQHCKKYCYKTAVYYALVNNCRAWKTIYFLLYELHNKSQLDIIDSSGINILHYFEDTECKCQIDEYCKGYMLSYLNFEYIRNILNKFIPIITNKFGILPEIINNKIHLDKLDRCVHKTQIFSHTSSSNHNYELVISQLLIVLKWYTISNKICILLFNQQAYELSQYILHNKYNNIKSTISDINNIYEHEIIDINYKSHNITFLSHVIINSNNKELLESLLDNGADPFIKDNSGNNALFLAINYRKVIYVNMLYKFKKDNNYLINEKNIMGQTPLMYILERNILQEFVELFIKLSYLDCGIIDASGKHILLYLHNSLMINYPKGNISSLKNDLENEDNHIMNSFDEDINDSDVIEIISKVLILDRIRILFIILQIVLEKIKIIQQKSGKKHKLNVKSIFHNNLMKFL